MEESTKANELRQRIFPILLYCQANKGDLSLYEQWKEQEDVGKKLFYAYYAGLFCRILCILDSNVMFRHFVRDCNLLLDKYNWYNIQKEDLVLYASSMNCEIPDALEYIETVDSGVWGISRFTGGYDAPCLKKEDGSTCSFRDIRGTIISSAKEP